MRIQYMSDLHMELWDNSRYIKANEFEVVGDVLVFTAKPLQNRKRPLGIITTCFVLLKAMLRQFSRLISKTLDISNQVKQ